MNNKEETEQNEKEENSSSPFDHQFNIAQLVQEIKALMDFKTMQAEKNNYLEQKLNQIDAKLQIQIPKDHLDAKDSLFLIGGSYGESCIAATDMYCTSQNVIKSLEPMICPRSHASVVELNGEIYVFGGDNGFGWLDSVESYNPIFDNWTLCPSLKQKKGRLSGAALYHKIFAVGGDDSFDSFSEVEMLDFDIGGWIPSCPMLYKRSSLAAVELNRAIYATGGYDGDYFLNSAERFDPREHAWSEIAKMNTNRSCHSMVVLNEKLYALGGYNGVTWLSSVEVFDPRLGIWMVEETSMNHARGDFGAAVVKDSIYVIGGINGYPTMVDTVENYKEGEEWKEVYTSPNVKRCYMSAIACSH